MEVLLIHDIAAPRARGISVVFGIFFMTPGCCNGFLREFLAAGPLRTKTVRISHSLTVINGKAHSGHAKQTRDYS